MGTKILIEGVHFKDLTVPDLVKFSFGIGRVNVILQLNTPGISAVGSLLNSSYFFDKENNISECLIYNAYSKVAPCAVGPVKKLKFPNAWMIIVGKTAENTGVDTVLKANWLRGFSHFVMSKFTDLSFLGWRLVSHNNNNNSFSLRLISS